MIEPDIFFVEDDEDFSIIMEMAVKSISNDVTIRIIADGKTALYELQQMDSLKVRPKIILLDLNLPGLSGIDILRRIKEIPVMKLVTIIIFSTSDNQKDIDTALKFGANAYIIKPLGFFELIACLEDMLSNWYE